MLTVVLEGGLVSAIVSDDPKDVGREVMVIDYDTEGTTDGVIEVPQKDGDVSEAVARIDVIEAPGIGLGEVERQLRGAYVILNSAGEQWSNSDGWVEVGNPGTVFTAAERHTLRLPIDGRWERIGEPV